MPAHRPRRRCLVVRADGIRDRVVSRHVPRQLPVERKQTVDVEVRVEPAKRLPRKGVAGDQRDRVVEVGVARREPGEVVVAAASFGLLDPMFKRTPGSITPISMLR
jgi:hypothetical protein